MQSSADHSSPASHAPWKPGSCGAVPGVRWGSPLKLGFSGQMPVSTTPTTTPRAGALGAAVLRPDAARAVEPEQVARAAAHGGRRPDGDGRPVDVLLGAPLDQGDAGHARAPA